jgi:outer membrane protein, heavy metal efflux system
MLLARAVLRLAAFLVLVAVTRAQERIATPLPAPNGYGYTLERVTGLALANNPTLRQAWARFEQAQGLAIQAGLYPNPTQNSGNPNQLGGDNSLYSVGVTQEFVRAGKIRLNQSAAQQAARQANLEFIQQRFQVLTDVRQQFFMLLAAERRITVLRELAGVTQKSVDSATRLLEGGQVSTGDVLLLNIEARRIEVALRSAEYTRNAISQQLAAVMGLPSLRIDRAVGNLAMPLPDFENQEERARLLASNTLVERARAEISRTGYLLQRAEVEPIPNLTWNGGYQWSVNQPHSQALVGLYFPIPIWDRNQGNIRAASANVRQSVAQVSAVQNDLTRQVAEALGRYRAARKTVELYERGILPDAASSLELSQQLLAAGALNLLRLLQTQRLVYESNLDYIAALQERLTSAAILAGLLQLDEFP